MCQIIGYILTYILIRIKIILQYFTRRQIFSTKKYTKHYTAPSRGDTQGLLSFHLFKCISDTNLPN